MKYLRLPGYALVLVFATVLLVFAVFSWTFSSCVREENTARTRAALTSINQHALDVMQIRWRELSVHVSALATLLGAQTDISEDHLLELLHLPGVNKFYTRMGLLFPDGYWRFNCASEHARPTCPLQPQNPGPPQLSAEQRTRSSFVTVPRNGKEQEAQAVVVAPVFQKGKLVATLAAYMMPDALYEFTGSFHLGQGAVSFLTDAQGVSLQNTGTPLPTGEDNFLSFLSTTGSKQKQVAEKVWADLGAHRPGLVFFDLANGPHALAYTLLGDSGWFAMTLLLPEGLRAWESAFTVPPAISVLFGLTGLGLLILAMHMGRRTAERIHARQTLLSRHFEYLNSCMPGGFLCCAADDPMTILRTGEGFSHLTGYSQGEVRDIFRNHYINMVHEDDRACLTSILKSAGENLHTEYRIVRKDGTVLWIRDKRLLVNEEDESFWFSVISDASEGIRLTEARQIQERRADALLEIVEGMVYDYQPPLGTVKANKAMRELFDIANPPFIFDRTGLDTSRVHPDDIGIYMLMRTRMLSGAPTCEGTVRIHNKRGSSQWYHLRMIAILDRMGKCAHIVGRVASAHDPKNLPLDRQKMQHDVLTGLLTRDGLKDRASAYLAHCEPDIVAAFCLLEVDDFVHVCHVHGGLAGEELVTLVAEGLRRIFRPSDMLARMDEATFGVLVKDMRDKQGILQKLDKIRQACVVEIVTPKGQHTSSACMGICFFPMQGRTFEQLLNYGEMSLISAKKSGAGSIFTLGEESGSAQ